MAAESGAPFWSVITKAGIKTQQSSSILIYSSRSAEASLTSLQSTDADAVEKVLQIWCHQAKPDPKPFQHRALKCNGFSPDNYPSGCVHIQLILSTATVCVYMESYGKRPLNSQKAAALKKTPKKALPASGIFFRFWNIFSENQPAPSTFCHLLTSHEQNITTHPTLSPLTEGQLHLIHCLKCIYLFI